MDELVCKIGTRRAIIFLGMSMALLFLASALLPTEPSAQTTSPEGKIVFVRPSTEPSDHCFGQPCADIWVMDADGSNQTNLTNTPDTNEGQPAWSSDGTRLAFTSDQDEVGGFSDIWVMDADGTDQTNLTPTAPDADNFHEYQPSWAPSGTQIVFVREVPGQIFSEQPDIFVMDTDPTTTDDATNITNTDASEIDPAWSPDGTKIAFAGVRNQGFEIVTMDPDGQNETILSGDSFDGDDRAPDWSPDSTKVVFMKQSQVGGCCEPWEIWGVNRDGSGDTNLSNHPSDDMGPSWSPDGSEITFTSNRDATVEEPFRADIYVMPAPTTLPPPSQSASVTTSQDSAVMDFAAGGVLVRTASAQSTSETAVRQLTKDGSSTEPDWADTPADTQAPRVTSTSPAAGAKDVARGTNVRATFSEQMDPASITKATFKLFKCPSTTSTNCTTQITNLTLSKSTDGLRATLNPFGTSLTLLAPRTKYKAVVTTGAKDLAGNRLDQDQTPSNGNQQKVWFFTVGASP
jgi:Tol biopolymer transport system component